MDVEEKIQQLCSYFRRQLEVINQLDVNPSSLPALAIEDRQVLFYRKVLLVTGLDTLAGIRFSKKNYPDLARHNRSRFTRFIVNFAHWDEGDYISLPSLQDFLDQKGLSSGALWQYISDRVSSFNGEVGGQLKALRIDEPSKIILGLTQSEREEEAVIHCQHFSLLYRYRSFLVHEWRIPGKSAEFDSLEDKPYYQGYSEDTKWHLIYPMQLFKNLFSKAVDGLQKYMTEKGIDPEAAITDTSKWLTKP